MPARLVYAASSKVHLEREEEGRQLWGRARVARSVESTNLRATVLSAASTVLSSMRRMRARTTDADMQWYYRVGQAYSGIGAPQYHVPWYEQLEATQGRGASSHC